MKYSIVFFLSLIGLLEGRAQAFTFTDSIVLHLKSGATVTATVCRNAADSFPVPAILLYSIYASPQVNRLYPAIAASRGYAGVVVNTRGKFLSDDETNPFEHDAEDAYEIIDWVSRQPWCNGKLGMYGASYLGFSQWASVKKLHPALKTIVPQAAVGAGIDFPMQNNVFSGYMLQWIRYVTNNKTIDLQDFGNSGRWDSLYKSWYNSGRSFRSLDSIEGRPNPVFQRWLDHPAYDEYWKGMTPQKDEFSAITIPVLTITGYYDDDQLGALYYYKQHTIWNKNPDHYLLIGPYNHEGVQSAVTPAVVSGYKTDSIAGIKIYKLIFDWFDYVLKDSTRPALLSAKINYQVMGANRWEHKTSMTEINTDTLCFYLSANRTLTAGKSNPRTFSEAFADLRDRGDTAGMNLALNITDTILHTNAHTLVFRTGPLAHDIEINGSIFGNLDMVINKRDLDLLIQLYELTADGQYILLNKSIFRASYARDNSSRNLLSPGQQENTPIGNTYFISKLIKRNSRLVFTLGVNKNYNHEINYGTGKEVSRETITDSGDTMRVKIYSDSFIMVPVRRER